MVAPISLPLRSITLVLAGKKKKTWWLPPASPSRAHPQALTLKPCFKVSKFASFTESLRASKGSFRLGLGEVRPFKRGFSVRCYLVGLLVVYKANVLGAHLSQADLKSWGAPCGVEAINSSGRSSGFEFLPGCELLLFATIVLKFAIVGGSCGSQAVVSKSFLKVPDGQCHRCTVDVTSSATFQQFLLWYKPAIDNTEMSECGYVLENDYSICKIQQVVPRPWCASLCSQIVFGNPIGLQLL